MTHFPRARTVGTLCLGTVLLGVGCTQSNTEEDGEPFPFPDKAEGNAKPSAADGDFPRPSFGPLARKTLSAPPPPDYPALALPVRPADTPTSHALRRDLLTSASDETLMAAPPPASPKQSPPEQAQPQTPQPAPILLAANDVPGADQTPLADEAENVPGPEALATDQTEPDVSPEPEPEPDQPSAEVPVEGDDKALSPAPDQPEVTAARTAAQPVAAAASIDIFAKLFASGSTQTAPLPSAPEAAESDAQPVSEPDLAEPRRRTIPARADTEASSAQEPAASEAPPSAKSAAKPLSLAAIVPPPRAPVRMVTTELPSVDPQPATPANDIGANTSPKTGPKIEPGSRSSGPATASTVSLPRSLDDLATTSFAPAPRTATTLGLGAKPASTPAPLPPTQTAQLGPDRGASGAVSAGPPTLTYQDELILELRVKGVDASDTILAYGTRSGIYLPVGTLARILDLAITVSDEGNYASGWVLDPKRTLAIDLTRSRLTVSGKELALARNAAVAFDGELFLLADKIQDFLPVKVEIDLRGQVVTLETLEPFPFEERMKREAERRRLASRAGPRDKARFPRQETPWLLASPPTADLEIRAVSDNTFGPRVEVETQLAGDLGFLTAQGFVSADSKNGLTASLITLGRQDPDGNLLGPLSATAFSVGDISTVSLPLGLRSVTGRGFAATNTPAEAVSVFEQIDLRGVLPDGYEVELYRNDILIGSTREAVNGRYEFLQVPVDFGLNIFRLVFFGPQGQRSEEVRRISVGDGRLPEGKLVYRFGVAQKDENVLGVRPPNFVPPRDRGNWRASAELAYGVSPGLTAVLSGGWFEPLGQPDRWLASAGFRTGLGGFAIKTDFAAQSGNAFALSGGFGGQVGGSAFTATHTEFSGDFIDETATIGSGRLRRSSELDFNTSLSFGGATGGFTVPITARLRHAEAPDGRTQSDATMRTSVRLAGMLASNTLEFNRISDPALSAQSRVFGNFDLATIGRRKTRGRVSLGYRVTPDPDITSASLELDHTIDQDTAIRGSVGYAFETRSTQVGLSAVRDFDRFRLALDGTYGLRDRNYSVGLRLGVSIGHDPLRGGFFIARPGLSSGGAASVRAFRDLDGDGVFGAGDMPLPDVDILAFNQSVPTGANGVARLDRLGSGKAVSLQVDSASLPDIDLAPATEGIEIVPRPGRIHKAEFPIIALSEVEGTLLFEQNGANKGVSGVRLILRDSAGKDVGFAKTELDGYFFFERVRPGTYTVGLDPEQSRRLNLCARTIPSITVRHEADLFRADLAIGVCETNGAAAP